jgi:hypothetical protein
VSARLQLEPRHDPLPALHALLDLPLRLEADGGFRALIVLDEFQDIVKVRGMDALLRSHIQFQGEVASFVFAGSEPGLMRELFEEKDRPLYAQAVPMRLGRLEDRDIAEYVTARFKDTGRNVGEALGPLLTAAQGHPQRAMLLAHRLWQEIEAGETGTLADWSAAHLATQAELQPEFDAHWRRLSTNEQKALRAVIAGRGSPFQRSVLEELDLKKSTARAALQSVVASADVEVRDDAYGVVDPLFAEWIASLRGNPFEPQED